MRSCWERMHASEKSPHSTMNWFVLLEMIHIIRNIYCLARVGREKANLEVLELKGKTAYYQFLCWAVSPAPTWPISTTDTTSHGASKNTFMVLWAVPVAKLSICLKILLRVLCYKNKIVWKYMSVVTCKLVYCLLVWNSTTVRNFSLSSAYYSFEI